MKRVAYSRSARTISILEYAPEAAAKLFLWVPRIPNYVWLAMIILTLTALSVSTLVRSQAEEREAQASYTFVKSKVENVRGLNHQIRKRTERIKTNPVAAAGVAQNNLRLVRQNEVVVIVP